MYKSLIIDISVDVRKETSGYFPGVKRTYSEYVIYDKYSNGPRYEDRGEKHLYGCHHRCSSSPSGYCNSFCEMKLVEGNHKLNDLFHWKTKKWHVWILQ